MGEVLAQRTGGGTGRQLTATEQESLLKIREGIRKNERLLARRVLERRIDRAALLIIVLALMTGVVVTVTAWELPAVYAKVDIICGVLIIISIVAAFAAAPPLSVPDRESLEHSLETNRAALRAFNSRLQPPLAERRGLYREDVADVIEKFQQESRGYRRIHNSLQSLIMVGSLSASTVSALDSTSLNWQQITAITFSFSVAVAAAFTGYFKFRERSFFLQQTADAIEEELNGLSLQIGEYSHDTEEEALARFTARVEHLRNEQRRRQQQLDQPAEQHPAQPPV
ncbi:DUF4231 domain-containing protein [Streptomyces sp. NPDC006332]|uniref:SLATT domain-containing protein n=1 Tax=Streptomyces sp. NPDC006332 TaxID=3155456 RepID=UPI0033AB5EE9